jgi:N-methylhydantoinase B
VTDPDIPPNQGCYDPVDVIVPDGSLLDPDPPAGVVGGNVETSQRVVDVVFAALAAATPERVPAGGQGTMNNLIVGSPSFTYYETIGGGAGATARVDGLDGVQVGMTNTLNTPIEALETEYPLRVDRYAYRTGSGGEGRHRGGDGLIRELTTTVPATVSLLTDRRTHPPRGAAGGGDGATGQNWIDGERVAAKLTREVAAETTVRIETPGGGGYGRADADESGRGEQSGESRAQ